MRFARVPRNELATVVGEFRAMFPPIPCESNGGWVPPFSPSPAEPGVWACGWIEQCDVELENGVAFVAMRLELEAQLPPQSRAILALRAVAERPNHASSTETGPGIERTE